MNRYDYILVGGGLANGLLALALRQYQPRTRVAMVEAADRLGGNHTWSFHEADVPPDAATLVDPLMVATWPAYETRFTDHSRIVLSRYAAITSARFDAVVQDAIVSRGWDLRLGTRAVEVGPDFVTLESGERLAGRCVIDARGPTQSHDGCGYQKFFGLEIETDEPWPDHLPVVMDSLVPQTDGFHFVYTLPFTANRVLVEDTYFSDTPALDRDSARKQVERYLSERIGGWRVIREESGVLPMPWRSAPQLPRSGPLVGGYAGGWFHPATGYSFPVVLRFALAVASVSPEDATRATVALARRLRFQWRFARFLNLLLFRLVAPEARWQVFARLYRTLPPSVLARFYALEFSTADAARIVVGRPPRIDLLRPLRRPRSNTWLSLSP